MMGSEREPLVSSVISVPAAYGTHQPIIWEWRKGPLSLPELLSEAGHGTWRTLRYFTLAATALAWGALLMIALALAAAAPPCQQLHRSSRCNSQIGSVQIHSTEGQQPGIRSKLDYVKSLGASAIWLSPIYKSPMVDFGYDISDFKDIDPLFGTMADFEALVQDMKKKGLRLVMDFVPNHSSDQHDWFLRSARGEQPYSDYYVWAKPRYDNVTEEGDNKTATGKRPPNNWLSVFGGSAWTYHDGRGEYYLHQFAPQQPDLNFRNEAVLEEMKEVLRFWLEKGVSGFRVDAASHLLEDELLRDEPRSERHPEALPTEYEYLDHVHTHGLSGVLDIIGHFRKTLDQWANDTDGEPRLLMAEVYDSEEKTMMYYKEAHFPFNFVLIGELGRQPNAQHVNKLVTSWTEAMPQGSCANWVLGNHDTSRVATRLGPELVDGLNMISLLLPGVSVTYYGEELGMENVPMTWEQTIDPAGLNAGPERFESRSRDPQRSPMQWTTEIPNAGFTTADVKTWLPVNEKHVKAGGNVENQNVERRSHLAVFRTLVEARELAAVKYGALNTSVLADGAVFSFTRIHEEEGILVALNLGTFDVTVDLQSSFSALPNQAELYSCSGKVSLEVGKSVSTSSLPLKSKDAVVLKFRTVHEVSSGEEDART